MSVSIGASSISTYNRLSGYVSGLDTETLVDGLTQNEKNRVIQAEREKQLLIWKRDAYREVINKLSDFYKKYFSSTSTLEDLFSKYTVTNTGSQYVSVVASSSAASKSVVIKDIESLATSSRLVSSHTVSSPATITVDIDNIGELSGKSMKITLDGTEKTITFSEGSYDSVSAVKDELQRLLDHSFGAGRVTVEENGNTLRLKSAGNSIVLGKVEDSEKDASSVLGFSDGQKNMISLTDTLANAPLNIAPGESGTFKINEVEFTFKSNYTFRDIMNMVNSSDAGVTMSYSSVEDKFILTSKTTGAGNQIVLEDVSGNLLGSLFGAGEFTDGTNAVIKICTNPSADSSNNNYVTIVKSSNTFEIDGITYNLLGKAEGNIEENIKIGVEFDTEGVLSNIKQFVEDYNSLLKSITDKLSEPKYRDFPPLTDEMREALGETKAAEYDAKAKSGLLRNDPYLRDIETELRKLITSEVKQLTDNNSSIGISLFEIGITTGSYSEKGQLKLDETKLREALTKNADKVAKLFTQKSSVIYSPYNTPERLEKRYNESGLLHRISDIIQNNILSTKGTLISLVGKTDNDYTSLYAEKLKDIDKKIERLREKYKSKQDYYWAKYSKLESALNNLYSQGNYLFSLTSQ